MSEMYNSYRASKKLKEYGYPATLRETVLRFSQLTQDYFSEFNPGVLLVGSTARGELSWIIEQNRVELFSDIEFLIGVTNKNPRVETLFKHAVSVLESDYDFGSLFHIDYTVIPWAIMRRLDKTYFVFESKCRGLDFGNRSVQSELPTVTRANLNWKELNEVFLHRMNSILSSFPLALLANEDASMRTFALALAKNTLDVTTWLHPYESVRLTAGFQRRLADLGQNLPKQQLGKYFSASEIEHLSLCLALRNEPRMDVDVRTMLENSILVYRKAIAYCKAINGIKAQESVSDVFASIKLFDEYRLRSRLRNAVSILENFRHFGLIKASKNMISVKKGIQANFGFHMLCAISEHLKNDDQCWNSMTVATSELNRLLPEKDEHHGDFVACWVNTRMRYMAYCHATR